MQKLFLLLFGTLPLFSCAQDEDLRMYDYIYKDNITSVLFHTSDSVLAYPIIPLNRGKSLRLSFDDMDADVKDYTYKLVHCDSDWTPSDLDELEYIDGFSEDDLRDSEFSFSTNAEFTHYYLAVPNEDMRLTVSGNYLLKVYEDEDEKSLAITRRFVVTERIMTIAYNFRRPAMSDKIRTHQEIDFSVSHPDIRVSNPHQEIKAAILQNGRWDNAIVGIKPKFIRNEKLVFDYQNKIVFPGGKEFRHLDLRTFEFRSDRVINIDEYDDHFRVLLHTDKPRAFRSYLTYRDVNGLFVIENLDRKVTGNGRQAGIYIPSSFQDVDSWDEVNALQSDYAIVDFSLKADIPFDNADVYIFSSFTDWLLKPEYKMEYNAETNNYEAALWLKQGYYNYLYAVAPRDNPQEFSFEDTEGDWQETENDYTIIVYFRPFGSRFDRVAAVRTINSLDFEN